MRLFREHPFRRDSELSIHAITRDLACFFRKGLSATDPRFNVSFDDAPRSVGVHNAEIAITKGERHCLPFPGRQMYPLETAQFFQRNSSDSIVRERGRSG